MKLVQSPKIATFRCSEWSIFNIYIIQRFCLELSPHVVTTRPRDWKIIVCVKCYVNWLVDEFIVNPTIKLDNGEIHSPWLLRLLMNLM